MEPIIQSLWIGSDLSKMEQLSIKSFIDHGHTYHLYTYDKVGGIPEGVVVKDGNEILDRSEIFRYKNGSISAFSNIFRFVLLYKKGGYWADTDLVCVKKLPFKENDIVFSSEPDNSYKSIIPNAGLIKIPKKHSMIIDAMKLLRDLKKDILNGKISWGLGPHTIKFLISKYNLNDKILDWTGISSCGWADYKSIFYPNTVTNSKVIKNIKDIPESMYCIHLWNEMLRQGGVDKNQTFDKASLYEQLKEKHNIN